MAKYLVTYQCGHAIDEQLYGKTDGRYEHIERQKSRLCPDCYRASQVARATEQAQVAGLPKLTGSDKQIAWGETIRSKKLTDIAAERRSFEALGARKNVPAEKITEELAKFDALVSKVTAQTEARFWIDNRDNGPIAIMRGVR